MLGPKQRLTLKHDIVLNNELKESAGPPDGEGVPW